MNCPTDCTCKRHQTAWNKGLTLTAAHRASLSIAKIGNQNAVGRTSGSPCEEGCQCKRHIGPWLDKKRGPAWNKGLKSESARSQELVREYRKEVAQALGKQRLTPHGPAHGNYRGHDCLATWVLRIWRTLVFKRDDYTCQQCGERGGKLNADHIIPKWADTALIYTLSNGRTLCYACHRQTDTYGWKAPKRPRQFQLPLPMVI